MLCPVTSDAAGSLRPEAYRTGRPAVLDSLGEAQGMKSTEGVLVPPAPAGAGPDPANIRFLRVPDLPIELYQRVNATRSTPRHVHGVFAVTVAERGAGIEGRKRGTHRMVPGSNAVINCGEMHSGDVPAGLVYSSSTIRLAPELLREYLGQITGRRQDALVVEPPVFEDPSLARAISLACRGLQQAKARLERDCSVLAVLAALYQRHGRLRALPPLWPDAHPAIRRAREFLQECPGADVSLAQLAAVVGISPFHFAKVFARCVGVPPHAFQLQVRLTKATDLLAAGKPQVEVALETGFCDQSHFGVVFRKVVGMTPLAYRRRFHKTTEEVVSPLVDRMIQEERQPILALSPPAPRRERGNVYPQIVQPLI